MFEPIPDDYPMRMTAGDFRWTLKWHGDFVRQLTLLEIRLKTRARRKSRTRRGRTQR